MLCDGEIHHEGEDVGFQRWVNKLKREVLTKTYDLVAPERVSLDVFSHDQEQAVERSSESDHIGDQYVSQLQLCAEVYWSQESWTKIAGLRNQYEERMIWIFREFEEQHEVPRIILSSPLPVPDWLMASSLQCAKGVIGMGWTIDCLGRTPLHVLLDSVHVDQWHSSHQQIFNNALDSLIVSVDSTDIFSRTALYAACENGHFRSVAKSSPEKLILR